MQLMRIVVVSFFLIANSSAVWALSEGATVGVAWHVNHMFFNNSAAAFLMERDIGVAGTAFFPTFTSGYSAYIDYFMTPYYGLQLNALNYGDFDIHFNSSAKPSVEYTRHYSMKGLEVSVLAREEILEDELSAFVKLGSAVYAAKSELFRSTTPTAIIVERKNNGWSPLIGLGLSYMTEYIEVQMSLSFMMRPYRGDISLSHSRSFDINLGLHF